ncbi:MAG: FeoA domain-containing protein [Planctomycetes bacterium]|nr:FeoA domain-containing protein [Planctomycetota bacterium]
MPDPLVALLVGGGVLLCGILCIWPRGGILGLRRRLRRLSTRVLVEDALKHIADLEIKNQNASAQTVAGVLQISDGRTARLLADMEQRSLVSFHEGRLRLTSKGREYALHIIRTHRLYERYLADVTGLSHSEWHRRAEAIEHRLSPRETEALSLRLGHPTHDPHGDPIPTAAGEIGPQQGQPLTSLPVDQPARIVHLEDEPETSYAQLIAESLWPGMEVWVLERDPQRIRFLAGGEEHVLAPSLADSITVEPIAEEQARGPRCEPRLSSLKPGQKGIVCGLSLACRGNERRRLLDLGFVPSTPIQVEMVSPAGDPTAYLVRGTLIALRREQADLIHVRPAPETAEQTAAAAGTGDGTGPEASGAR